MSLDTIIIDKIKNTILYSIYGDTFGVPFELWSQEFIKKKINEIIKNEDYIIHNNNKIVIKLVKTHKNKFIGEYSDDSEMILATMDSIIINCGINNNLLETFKKYYTSDRGYGINTSKLLNGEIINTINQSTSNGGLMRICPVAIWNFYSNSCDLEQDIINDLKITNHNSIESFQTCLLFSKMIIYFLNLNNSCDIKDFIRYITDVVSNLNIIKEPILLIINNYLEKSNELEIINKLEIYTTDCISSMQKVLNAFLFHYDEPNVMIPYVNSYGGDTDTNCNLIGSLIGARFGSQINSNVEFDKIENIENIIKLTDKFTNVVMERYANLKEIKTNIKTLYIGL